MLWEVIKSGDCMIEKFSFDLWDYEAVTALQLLSVDVKQQICYGGFMKDTDFFDAGAFKIFPSEAAEMDLNSVYY